MQQQQTYQTPSWNQVVSDLNAYVNPPRCSVCGRAHAPSPTAATATDWLSQWNEMPIIKEWNRVWSGVLDPLMQGMKPAAGHSQPPQHQHKHEHEHQHQHHGAHERKGCCSCCQPDDCHCRCCVVNADLLVYARYGESRVVPVTIENNMRREREVELELSDWTTHGKQEVKVMGHIVPETKFTLKPCEERTVVIAVRVSGEITTPYNNLFDNAGAGVGVAAPGANNATGGQEARVDQKQERLPDVDSCTVFYADLRVKGCDIMPIRIAVVILPRDCDAYKIDCRCGCCC